MTTIKHRLRMPDDVTSYDDEITQLFESAKMDLKVAGITSDNALTDDFIFGKIRLGMAQDSTRLGQDTSTAFVTSETTRLSNILAQLSFSKEGDA